MNAGGVYPALAILVLFLGLILFFARRVQAGHFPSLRRIQAFNSIKGAAARAVEEGRPFHLGLGTGHVTDVTTADTLAGLYTLDYLAEQAAATNAPPIVTMADPAAMLLAHNSLRQAYGEKDSDAVKAYRDVRFIGPQPATYAAGLMALLGVEDAAANVLIGRFGDEYLLMGEAAAWRNTEHIGGTSDPNVLPFVYASAQETLLGEEIFATGAYLQRKVAHVGSLLAQDTMRWLISLAIGLGVITKTIGLW
ncbi:MAG TPA: hypothetical protein PKE64_08670 [Anaerolineae bacterium]|nr:hypothetical protein [Anaerolineae bacterium]HMR64068.1 hypothetical protein [Anaerolineae bacterium]